MRTAPTGLALYGVMDRPWRLIRIDYRDGIEAGRAELPVRGDRLVGVGGERIYADRVCYTDEGTVIDLATGEVKVPPAGHVIGKDGNRLIVRRRRADNYPFAIDLDTFAEIALTAPNRWQLPGVRSPGGTRTVATAGDGAYADPGELWLYDLGEPPRVLAEGLRVSLSQVSSATPDRPPKLWVDETHVLTQRDNGELIVLRDDGAVVATILLPLDERDRRVVMPPRLWRDLDGRIVYSCGGHFRINPADREWGGYPWRPVGCGFAVETVGGAEGVEVTHHGESLGRIRLFGLAWAACPGQLAISLSDGLHVWSVEAGWQASGPKLHDIIGWVDRREEMT